MQPGQDLSLKYHSEPGWLDIFCVRKSNQIYEGEEEEEGRICKAAWHKDTD